MDGEGGGRAKVSHQLPTDDIPRGAHKTRGAIDSNVAIAMAWEGRLVRCGG